MSDPSDISIELDEGPTGGAYRFREGDNVAELAFSRTNPKLIIIDHTEVPPFFRGRRLGEKLVARAVEDARAAGGKIFPLCPFAASQFRRHPEYKDVLSR